MSKESRLVCKDLLAHWRFCFVEVAKRSKNLSDGVWDEKESQMVQKFSVISVGMEKEEYVWGFQNFRKFSSEMECTIWTSPRKFRLFLCKW